MDRFEEGGMTVEPGVYVEALQDAGKQLTRKGLLSGRVDWSPGHFPVEIC